MLSRATDPTAVPNSVHIGEREGNNTSGRAGVNLTVSVNVSLLVHGAAPELLGLGLGFKYISTILKGSEQGVRYKCKRSDRL